MGFGDDLRDDCRYCLVEFNIDKKEIIIYEHKPYGKTGYARASCVRISNGKELFEVRTEVANKENVVDELNKLVKKTRSSLK